MMKEFLFNLIRKRKYDISIYTEEIFERRCQEEIIRSDEDNSSFVYLEFNFEQIKKELPDESTYTKFWEVFLATLSKSTRSSDIVGLLENGSGLGVLLLDSKMDGWHRVKGRIVQMAKVMDFADMDTILEKEIKPILYPTCIQDLTAQPASSV